MQYKAKVLYKGDADPFPYAIYIMFPDNIDL
jgi:hypothetical protein